MRQAGIDLDDVTDTLLHDGIDAFVTPMQKLLAGIDAHGREHHHQRYPTRLFVGRHLAREAVLAEKDVRILCLETTREGHGTIGVVVSSASREARSASSGSTPNDRTVWRYSKLSGCHFAA